MSPLERRNDAPCPTCGFRVGDAVKMVSGMVGIDLVHGTVEHWNHGCGHIVAWRETGAATALPNPNVERDA